MSLLDNLKTIIQDNVDYLNSSGYVNHDAWQLVDGNKFPFFNLIKPGGFSGRVPSMASPDFERKKYKIEIQFAVGALDPNKLFVNEDDKTFDDVVDDIWNAVQTDKTLSGAVDGIVDDAMEWVLNQVGKPGSQYVATGSMDITFYKDVAK